MSKKSILLAMSVTALVAFAVPASARATEPITNVFGEEANAITAVSENMLWTSHFGTWSCDTVTLNLVRTGTGTYHGSGAAVGGATKPHSGPCISSAGFHIHYPSITANVTNEGGGSGTANFTYNYQFTTPVGTLNCKWSLTGGSARGEAGEHEISVEGALVGSGANCPAGGQIHGDFTVTDETGSPAVIH